MPHPKGLSRDKRRKSQWGLTPSGFCAINQADRVEVLVDEKREDTLLVLRSVSNLGEVLATVQKVLAECADSLRVRVELGSRISFQRLVRAERLLSQARHSLSEMGWFALETSGTVKRLQEEVSRISRRIETHEKTHAT